MRVPFHLIGLLLAGGLATGCATHAQPLPSADPPGLNAPEPPVRYVVPPTEEPTLPAAVEPPSGEAPPAATSKTPVRNPSPRPSTPPAVEAPPVPTPTPAPAHLLTSANTAEFELRVNKQLDLARSNLAKVKREDLGADAKAHFDAAQGFIRQAVEALKVKNLIYAGQLADKAATMAALLRK